MPQHEGRVKSTLYTPKYLDRRIEAELILQRQRDDSFGPVSKNTVRCDLMAAGLDAREEVRERFHDMENARAENG